VKGAVEFQRGNRVPARQ